MLSAVSKRVLDFLFLREGVTIPRQGERINAKVVSVYDGDTLTVDYRFGTKTLREKIRIAGIDTPEITVKTADKPNPVELKRRNLEKKAGLKVRDELRKRLENSRFIQVRLLEPCKYRRVVGDVFCHGSVAKWLLQKGYAKEYGGGTRGKWTEAELQAILRS